MRLQLYHGIGIKQHLKLHFISSDETRLLYKTFSFLSNSFGIDLCKLDA